MKRIPPPKPRRDQDAIYVKLLGLRLSTRDSDPQVVEFQAHVVVWNGLTGLGTPLRKSQARSVQGYSGDLQCVQPSRSSGQLRI